MLSSESDPYKLQCKPEYKASTFFLLGGLQKQNSENLESQTKTFLKLTLQVQLKLSLEY
jgi:hypothetical protein